MTYEEYETALKSIGIPLDKVMIIDGRALSNIFYADYDKGQYLEMFLAGNMLHPGSEWLKMARNAMETGNPYFMAKDWAAFYEHTVPATFQIDDFQRRYKEIPVDDIFNVWMIIHCNLYYSFGMWDKKVLEYVFSHAPPVHLPNNVTGDTLTVYRGVCIDSGPLAEAISWSLDINVAIRLAAFFGTGARVYRAQVSKKHVIAYLNVMAVSEHEVLIRYKHLKDIEVMDIISADDDSFEDVVKPVTLQLFLKYGSQADLFDAYYQKGSHGKEHALGVLMLSLIYEHNSGDDFSHGDLAVLVNFALLHDIGRRNDEVDDTHGQYSVSIIKKKGLSVPNIKLKAEDARVLRAVIRTHCLDDETGRMEIASTNSLTNQEKERAKRLLKVCKDMDGLERMRFHDLDLSQLRRPYSKRLPFIAGYITKIGLRDLIEACMVDNRARGYKDGYVV